MSSPLVRSLVEKAGLAPLLAARARGEVPSPDAWREVVASADVLALGAAADEVRRRECGDDANVWVPCPPRDADVLVVGPGETSRGTTLLRKIAALRLFSRPAARIAVDFDALGLEIANVALTFGASDLAGTIATKRGLPLAEGEGQKQAVRKREIAQYVEQARYRPVFVQVDARRRPPAPAEPHPAEGA